ncbi:MAG: M42 family metallopeptidase [Candidatus Heimdallarchaeaceae archaeon]
MDLLEKLISTFGVSGNEEAVRNIIMEEIKNHVDEVFVDKLGNLIAHKKGERPKVMLAAHMDEIGLMAKGIGGRGRISFSTVGEVDPVMLLGERVHIETKKGIIHGVITCKEVNDGNILERIPKIEDLFVDTGLNKNDLKKLGIEVGTFMALERDLYYLGSDKIICGKAFDDRIGCYILIELAKRLKETCKNEIYYVFTIQEEIGLVGALTSAYIVEPDWAIVVDVTETDDASGEATKTIGRGPCLTIKDAETVGNKILNKHILEIAKRNKIHIQRDVSDEGTTDAASISITKGGVPCTVLGVCIRNLHTATSVANRKDIEKTIKILEELLKLSPDGELWR